MRYSPTELVTLHPVSQDGWFEPCLVLNLIKAVRTQFSIIYSDFMVVTAHVMCAVLSLILPCLCAYHGPKLCLSELFAN